MQNFEVNENSTDKEMAVFYAVNAMLAEYEQCAKEVDQKIDELEGGAE